MWHTYRRRFAEHDDQQRQQETSHVRGRAITSDNLRPPADYGGLCCHYPRRHVSKAFHRDVRR